MVKRKKQNARERAVALRTAAMPDVKRLVKKYGRTAVAACINKLREQTKLQRKIADLRREADRLEKAH